VGTRQRATAGLVAVAASFAFAGVGPAHAATAAAAAASAAPSAGCDPVLDVPDRGVSGERAVDALTDAGAVQQAAAGVDLSPRAYTAMLRDDPRLRVDDCAGTFAVDPAQPEPAGPFAEGVVAAGGVTDTGALDSSGDAFALSSRPGSTKTLYLDFRGMRMTAVSWNRWAGNPDFTLPPFSLDADGTTFSAAEQDAVRGIWIRVAEDYAPFDINVTTADPGLPAIDRTSSADAVYGTRVLVTSDTYMYGKCGCGGIAYVDVFDSTGSAHESYQPALVFAKGLGSGTKAMAEAASHEAGHNLGLHHDGRTSPEEGYYGGQGSWAPIMGVSYSKPVTQWSSGEYINASETQDDLAVIASNGPGLVADDHGNTAATATVLPVGGTAGGLISTRGDVDYFALALSAAGPATVRVTPQRPAANLDTQVSLYDATGTLVGSDDPAVTGTADPAPGLASSLSRMLAAGTYYLAVDGVGYADPATTGYSDYASLGRYTVTVDAALTVPLVVGPVSAPAGTVGQPYALSLTATGGKAPYTWTPVAALPAGLALSSSGVVSGAPSRPGTTTTTVRVTDAAGATATGTVTLTVVAAAVPVTVTPVSASSGVVGTPYSLTLTAAGGTAPYTWSVESGTLPAGLWLSTGGVLSGTPTAAGTTTVVARATDAAPGSPQSATGSVTMTVTAAPLRVTPVTLPTGTVGTAYPARTFAATGGTGRYTWSRASGALPPGLSLSGAGRLSGTPTRTGTYAFVVRATDSAGRRATLSTSVRVAARASTAKAGTAQVNATKASARKAAKAKAKAQKRKRAAARRAALRRERAARS
jgi:hypothetical protein